MTSHLGLPATTVSTCARPLYVHNIGQLSHLRQRVSYTAQSPQEKVDVMVPMS